MKTSFFSILVIFSLISSHSALLQAAQLDEEVLLHQTQEWMEGHPLFENHQPSFGAVDRFPESEESYQFLVVHLIPTGYLVINTDDRLPLVVAYSANSRISFEDHPDNAFRAFLIQSAAITETELAAWDDGRPPIQKQHATVPGVYYPEGDFVFGPYMNTQWNQNYPYNYYTQQNVNDSEYYNFQAPTGCVPTAMAQVMHYHSWPVSGISNHTYEDDEGNIQGNHSADFSDPYDWLNMKQAHGSSDSNVEKAAIGELMYELGISVEVNYEADETSAYTTDAADALGNYFRYMEPSFHWGFESLNSALDNDLLLGYPAIVTIPGHAVVADGILRLGDDINYHINYGWGGTNNGWFSYESVPNGAINGGITSIYPEIIGVPATPNIAFEVADDCEIDWKLPKRSLYEIDRLDLYHNTSGDDANPVWQLLETDIPSTITEYSKTTTVWDNCDSFDDFTKVQSTNGWLYENETWTQITNGWERLTAETTGNIFHVKPNIYGTHILTSKNAFLVENQSNPALHINARIFLASATFKVMVSEDGNAFEEIASYTNMTSNAYTDRSIDISEYSGKSIYLQFEYNLTSGQSYYPGGGLSINTIGIDYIENPELEKQPLVTTTISHLSGGEHTLALQAIDLWGYAYPVGDPIAVTVNQYTTYNVLFDEGAHGTRNGGGALSQTVNEEQSAQLPTIDSDPGWNFISWDHDGTNIQSDLTIHAQYEAILAASGTPMWWLIENNLVNEDATTQEINLAESTDIVGKGYPTSQDFIAGTDPWDATDKLCITKIQCTPPSTDIILNWTGKSDRTYRIYKSTTLGSEDWTLIHTRSCSTNNQPMSFIVNTSSTPATFFKIKASIE